MPAASYIHGRALNGLDYWRRAPASEDQPDLRQTCMYERITYVYLCLQCVIYIYTYTSDRPNPTSTENRNCNNNKTMQPRINNSTNNRSWSPPPPPPPPALPALFLLWPNTKSQKHGQNLNKNSDDSTHKLREFYPSWAPVKDMQHLCCQNNHSNACEPLSLPQAPR